MGYCLYDSNGYVGDLASVTGMEDLADYLEPFGESALQHFLDTGWCPVDLLQADIQHIPEPPDPEVRDTWNNFKEMVAKCADVAIISDGVE